MNRLNNGDPVALRKFGVDLVGQVPWGTRLCQLYGTKQDLIDILAPYFAAGLLNNEACLLISSAPLQARDAKKALELAIPDLDQYLQKGQIEIVPFESVYQANEKFRAQEIPLGWVEKEKAAQAKGFEGLRVSSILPSNDDNAWRQLWKVFEDYDQASNSILPFHQILVLCNYPVKKCSAGNIVDIERSYDGVLIRRERDWLLVEDSGKRKESEAWYSNIIQTSIDGFWMVNSAGLFQEVNGAYCNLIGYSRDELLTMGLHDVEMTENPEEIVEHIRKIVELGHDRFETRHCRKDGQPVDIEVSANYLEGKDPSKLIFAFAHNVTKRKRNEETIRHSEARYRELADSITDSFVALDRDLRYVYWNKACEKITGIPAEDAIGRTLFEVFHEDEGTRKVANTYLKVLKTRRSRVFIDELMMDGKKVAVENHIYPSRTGISVFSKDITQRKELQNKLEEYTQRLEDLVKIRTEKLKTAERLATIGETAGMVGHDIRNPLQTISGELYLARNEVDSLPEGDSKQQLKESISSIGEQLAYINKIVADLQDFAKSTKPFMEDIDLEKTIQSILTTVTIPEDVRVEVSFAKNYPKLRSDSSFLRRILINLMTNAVQAMPAGGKLSVSAKFDAKTAYIAVQDTGQGIPEEAKANIFKPLFTTKAKGQGLGLAVVKKLTTALGGDICFESAQGKGTRFNLALPLHFETPMA